MADWISMPSAMVAWLVGNTLVALLISIAALVADRCLKRPAIAHLCWVIVLVKLVTPPVITFAIPIDLAEPPTTISQDWNHPWGAWNDSADHERLSRLGSAMALSSTPDRVRWQASSVLVFVWSLGGLGVMIWIVRASRRVHRLIERRGRFDIEATRRLASIAGTNVADGVAPNMGGRAGWSSKKLPDVWLVDAVVSPMLISPLIHMKPNASRIIFPKALWVRLDHDGQNALLLHELEHDRRRDFVVRFIEVTTMIALWWHPLVWIAKSQIEDCEERCCDLAASRKSGKSPRVYAEAILKTLDFLCEPLEQTRCEVGTRPVASGVGRFPKIEQRLRQIMRPRFDIRQGPLGWVVLSGMLFLIPVYPTLIIRRPAADTAVDSVTTDRTTQRSVLSAKSKIDSDIIPRFGSPTSP